jgi:cobalt-zinc-cadmium efflux system membrane fusion protein
MYAVVTFRSRRVRPALVVPATAIMRLHDKDWVFRKEISNRFRRVEVQGIGAAPDGMQEVRDGLKADDEVVLKALDFSTAVAEKKE